MQSMAAGTLQSCVSLTVTRFQISLTDSHYSLDSVTLPAYFVVYVSYDINHV
jgi:hypothetical protein